MRIRKEALTKDHPDGWDHTTNIRDVEENGWLWLFVGPHKGNTPEDGERDTLWVLRSIATGKELSWFRFEFETTEEEAIHD